MIKNFLASAVGLRKETHTFPTSVTEGMVIAYSDENSDTRYGVVFTDRELKEGETGVVGSIVTAGHIIIDNVDFGDLGDLDYEEFIQNAAVQGLYFERAKVTVVPADVATDGGDSASSN